jgi:hypothetical protein
MSEKKDLSQLDDKQVEELRGHLREFVSGVKDQGFSFLGSLITAHHDSAHRDKVVPDIPPDGGN